jgi:hypothetical protein
MRTSLLVAIMLVAIGTCSAAPMCGSGSLSTYLGLGSDGCSIGSSTFNQFSLLELPFGATAIDAAGINVTPVTDSNNPGFTFTINGSASAGQLLEILLGYVVTGGPIAGNTISMTGNSVIGDGAVTVVEDKCIGGVFAPMSVTGCTGLADTLILFDIGIDAQTSARLTFPTVMMLGVVTDIAIDGGLGGSGALGSVTTQFQTIPEPSSVLITGGGVGALLLAMRRSKHRKAMKWVEKERV